MFGLRSKQETSAFRRIGFAEFEKMRNSGRPPFLLDVREPFELQAHGRVPGVVNIPLGQIEARRHELPEGDATPIVAICQSGARSQRAAATLARMGYREVYSLDGGTLGWQADTRRR
jgi:rhodanese-related sulfurtransferase